MHQLCISMSSIGSYSNGRKNTDCVGYKIHNEGIDSGFEFEYREKAADTMSWMSEETTVEETYSSFFTARAYALSQAKIGTLHSFRTAALSASSDATAQRIELVEGSYLANAFAKKQICPSRVSVDLWTIRGVFSS